VGKKNLLGMVVWSPWFRTTGTVALSVIWGKGGESSRLAGEERRSEENWERCRKKKKKKFKVARAAHSKERKTSGHFSPSNGSRGTVACPPIREGRAARLGARRPAPEKKQQREKSSYLRPERRPIKPSSRPRQPRRERLQRIPLFSTGRGSGGKSREQE